MAYVKGIITYKKGAGKGAIGYSAQDEGVEG